MSGTCKRCGKAVVWDQGDMAWSDADRYNLVCVEGADEDGADDLGHDADHYSDETVGHAAFNGRVEPPITLRTFHDARRFDLFVGGWRVGIYKTEAGARRRAAREDGV